MQGVRLLLLLYTTFGYENPWYRLGMDLICVSRILMNFPLVDWWMVGMMFFFVGGWRTCICVRFPVFFISLFVFWFGIYTKCIRREEVKDRAKNEKSSSHIEISKQKKSKKIWENGDKGGASIQYILCIKV